MPEVDSTTPEEIWKPVVDFEQLYSVSNLGKVRRDAKGQGARVGIILKPRTLKSSDHHRRLPYRRVLLCEKEFYVHVLVARAFLGEPPSEHEVNHKLRVLNGDALSNLEYLHYIKNRGQPGSKRNVKLTKEQVIEIRMLSKQGKSVRNLAKQFGVVYSHISSINRRVTWKDVE